MLSNEGAKPVQEQRRGLWRMMKVIDTREKGGAIAKGARDLDKCRCAFEAAGIEGRSIFWCQFRVDGLARAVLDPYDHKDSRLICEHSEQYSPIDVSSILLAQSRTCQLARSVRLVKVTYYVSEDTSRCR